MYNDEFDRFSNNQYHYGRGSDLPADDYRPAGSPPVQPQQPKKTLLQNGGLGVQGWVLLPLLRRNDLRSRQVQIAEQAAHLVGNVRQQSCLGPVLLHNSASLSVLHQNYHKPQSENYTRKTFPNAGWYQSAYQKFRKKTRILSEI